MVRMHPQRGNQALAPSRPVPRKTSRLPKAGARRKPDGRTADARAGAERALGACRTLRLPTPRYRLTKCLTHRHPTAR
jgi:hypothetical protein